MCAAKTRKSSRLRYFVNNLPEYEDSKKPIIDSQFLITEVRNKSLMCATKQPCTKTKNLDGGLYVGASGIGYMFYHMIKSPAFAEDKQDLLKRCLDIMGGCLEYAKKSKHADSSDKCGFLLGNAGIYAVAAAVFNAAGKESDAEACLNYYKEVASICMPATYADFGGDELFVGRAGYICGALWLNKEFKREVVPESIINCMCITLVESGKRYAKRRDSPCPLMYSYYGVEYLGAAHGLCAILQMILSCDTYLAKHPSEEKCVKASVDFLLSIQRPSGNFPCAMDDMGRNASSEEDELIHWCHGAPGVVYLMAKAYLKWKEDKYLQAALKCGEVTWQKGLLRKGPGICHGVSGSGYVFLLLYRLTGDDKHLHRAYEFAKYITNNREFLQEARTPDSPYSLYEGYAGAVCFLTDFLQPSTAAFPFMDVFC